MKIKINLLLWHFCFALVFASSVDKLTFVTEEYPPFNYTQDGRLQGKSTQIIQKLLEISNSNQSVENILVVPWAVGYDMALSTPNTALFSTTKTAQRDALFKWIGPLASHKTVLLAYKDLQINSKEEISSLRVVVIHKDVGAQLLANLSTKPKQIITAASNIEAAQMLYYGRVDAWAYGESTGHWILQQLGLNPQDYPSILTLGQDDLYIALHPDSDIDAINALKAAYEKLQQDTLAPKETP
jgi:polar amino acid transport system substrate-binding protein